MSRLSRSSFARDQVSFWVALSVAVASFVSLCPAQTEDDYVVQQIAPVAVADLSLRQAIDNTAPEIGSEVRLTLEVNNRGPSDANDVVVTLRLPDGLSLVGSEAGAAGSYDSDTGTWTLEQIPANSTKSLVLIATVNPARDHTSVAEVIAAREKDADSEPGNGVTSEDDYVRLTIVPVPLADLSLTQELDAPTAPEGAEAIFTLRLTNAGPSDATGVVVAARLPDGLKYVGDDGGGSYAHRSGRWKVGRLPAGDEAQLTITAKVGAGRDRALVAEVTGAGEKDPDSTPSNRVTAEDDYAAQAVELLALADLSLAQSVDNAVPDVGGTVTFTLTVRNNGPSDATGVVVSDRLPSGYRYVRHTGDGVYDDESGEWVIGALAADATAKLQLRAEVRPDGEYVNVAEIAACDQPDPDSRPGDWANRRPREDQDRSAESLTQAGEPVQPRAGGTAMPRRIPESYVAPVYPTLPRRAGVTGQVRLSVLVRSNGTVGGVEVIEANPGGKGFEESAIAAVRQWRYEPATRNGQAVDESITVTIEFR